MDADLLVRHAVGADSSESHELTREWSTEWRSLRTRHQNVLLEGPRTTTEAVLSLLKLRTPVNWKRPGTPLVLGPSRQGTLVLQDVAALDAEEQNRVFLWLDDATQRTQVVSTSTTPLFPLVARGLFDEALYYRLNVLLLRVESSGNLESRA